MTATTALTVFQAVAGILFIAAGVCFRTTFVANAMPVLVGAGTTLLAGLIAGAVVKLGNNTVPPPHDEIDPPVPLPGAAIGVLERIFFFSTIWAGQQPVGIVAWLGFKVAAKWNAWSHIVRVPEKFLGDDLEGMRFRLAWSSHILSRFLIGTLYNVLCGVAGAAVGWLIVRFIANGGVAL